VCRWENCSLAIAVGVVDVVVFAGVAVTKEPGAYIVPNVNTLCVREKAGDEGDSDDVNMRIDAKANDKKYQNDGRQSGFGNNLGRSESLMSAQPNNVCTPIAQQSSQSSQ
jgi:hypothetical protein